MSTLDLLEVLPAYFAFRRRFGIVLSEIVVITPVEEAVYNLDSVGLYRVKCQQCIRTLAILRGRTNVLGSTLGALSRLKASGLSASVCVGSSLILVASRDDATFCKDDQLMSRMMMRT